METKEQIRTQVLHMQLCIHNVAVPQKCFYKSREGSKANELVVLVHENSTAYEYEGKLL